MGREKSKTGFILLITSVAALGGLLFGFDIAIITGAVPFIRNYFDLNELQLGWAVSSLLVGCVFGAAIAGRLADIYGRKIVLFYVAILFAITSLTTGLATTFSFFVISRLLGGVAVGAASAVSPLYISEIAPYKIRGRLVSFYQLSIVFGIILSYFINYQLHDIGPDNWRWMFISGVVPSTIFFIALFFVPETPRFLYTIGRTAQARVILNKIEDTENAEKEMQQIENSLQGQNLVPIAELFSKKYRKVMFVGFGLAVFVQLCGINVIVDYAPIILATAGWEIDAALFATFVIGAVFFSFTFVSIWLIEKIGRRPLYLIGSSGLTIILFSIVTMSVLGKFSGNIALGLIMAFVAIFSACIGPVFWTLVSEIFPNKVRGSAMSFPVFTQWIANAVVVGFFPWMLAKAGPSITFGILGVCTTLMLIFTYYFVPETKGKTLEEIEDMWNTTQH